jgi:hypothetical protein
MGGGGGGLRRGGGSGGGRGEIWVVGADGNPERVRIRQKISDGTSAGVEVIGDVELEGREVIVGINTASTAPAAADNNPFAPRMPGGQSPSTMRRAMR